MWPSVKQKARASIEGSCVPLTGTSNKTVRIQRKLAREMCIINRFFFFQDFVNNAIVNF